MAKMNWIQIIRRIQLLFVLITLPLSAYTIHYYSADTYTPGPLYSVVITGASFAVAASFWSTLACTKFRSTFFDISVTVQWLLSFILLLVGSIKVSNNPSAFCFRSEYYCTSGPGYVVGIVTLVLAAVNCKLFVITLIFDRVSPCAAGNVEARENAVDDKEIDMKNLEA